MVVIFIILLHIYNDPLTFFQRNFRVIQETVKVNVSSPDLIEDATIYIKKYNRTFDALNSTATFKQWLNDSIFVC